VLSEKFCVGRFARPRGRIGTQTRDADIGRVPDAVRRPTGREGSFCPASDDLFWALDVAGIIVAKECKGGDAFAGNGKGSRAAFTIVLDELCPVAL